MKKILLIEDDTALRASIVQTLELEGFEPIATGSFVQARRSIRSNFKGVVLSDINMPEHDGFDVLKFSQSKDPDLPVIMLTAFSDVPNAIKSMKMGAYDYLEKPCNTSKLLETLARALQHRELVFENRELKSQLEQRAYSTLQGTLSEQLEVHEKEIIERALSENNGKVSASASALGLPRNTLYDKISRLKLYTRSYKKTP